MLECASRQHQQPESFTVHFALQFFTSSMRGKLSYLGGKEDLHYSGGRLLDVNKREVAPEITSVSQAL